MKNSGNIFLTAIMIISLWTIILPSKSQAQGYGEVSFDIFHNELSPYGQWDSDPHYGNIWFPSVQADFRPYGTNGYWTMTNYGNTWVSNYPWGWAPFHYGRWVYTDYRGWGWIPGYEWGPAWVEWRSGNGYYGWAPMAPTVSINISIGLPINLWIFAPSRQIYNRNIYRYSSYGRPNIYNNTTIINNTYIVNNHRYHGGPSRRDIERSLGRRVAVRDITHTDRPGSSKTGRNSVSIYRPDRNPNNKLDSKTKRNEGIAGTDRNNRGLDNRNSSTNRISREMYIGKDGNSIIRERNKEVKRNNTTLESINRNESRTNNRQTERARQWENRSNTSTSHSSRNERSTVNRNRTEQTTPIRTSESRKPERQNRPVQERKANSTIHTTSQTSNTRNTNRSEQMSNRESRSTSTIGRNSNTGRQSSTSSSRSGSENVASRRN